MRKLLASLALLITLSSCAALKDTIDHTVDQGKTLVTHVTDEVRDLKTETLEEVRTTIEDVTPQVVESILNADAIAFLIVSVTILGGLVVVVALMLLLGAAKAAYKRWQHPKDCSAR